MSLRNNILKLINYSSSSHPTRACYSGQVNGSNEKRVENTAVFETISNTDANFLNLHIDKATKTLGDKELYFIHTEVFASNFAL